MKSILPLITLCLFLTSTLKGQQPVDSIANIGSYTINIDGSDDDYIWSTVDAINIDKPFQLEEPTLNSATWKAVWNEEGIYLLVEASDDVWMPNWVSGLTDWESDKVEVYIDVTTPQKDGGGAIAANGNHSIGANFNQSPGVAYQYGTEGSLYSCSFDAAGNYKMEYFIAFEALPDNSGQTLDPSIMPTIGFDVTVIDLDDVSEGRNRAVWANTGAIDESWNNMDDVGLITLTYSDKYLIAVFDCSEKLKGPEEDIFFTDNSGGNPTEWFWDFGDGKTSTEQNPVHRYSSTGNFSVSLTIRDVNDSVSTIVKSDFITITDAAYKPNVDFSSSLLTVKTNQPIVFTDESTYNPTSWTWYFGDGSISTKQNPTHNYRNEGVYSVTLVASNLNGSGLIEKSNLITVTKGSAPNAAFSTNKTTFKTGEEIQFSDESANYPSEWLWDFGDGKTSTNQHPVHTYWVPGNYTVSLAATNSEGSHAITKEAYIQVEASASLSSAGSNHLHIYPNPSTGVIYIDYNATQNSELRVKVLDIAGKEVKNFLLDYNSEKYINLSNQAKGLYFIILQTNGEIITEKVLIQ